MTTIFYDMAVTALNTFCVAESHISRSDQPENLLSVTEQLMRAALTFTYHEVLNHCGELENISKLVNQQASILTSANLMDINGNLRFDIDQHSRRVNKMHDNLRRLEGPEFETPTFKASLYRALLSQAAQAYVLMCYAMIEANDCAILLAEPASNPSTDRIGATLAKHPRLCEACINQCCDIMEKLHGKGGVTALKNHLREAFEKM